MDPVSQGALGAAAALSIWGRDRRLSPRIVGWLGALSAMAPDLDIFIRSSSDSLLAIEYHRHFTHSLAFVPVGATIALLPWLLNQSVRTHWKLAWAVSFIGYLTHAPLDCATTYGTLFFWPVSDYRVSLSWVSVVDPLFTLPMLALLIGGGLRRRPRAFQIAFAWALFYLGLGSLQKTRVSAVQKALIEDRGHTATRRSVFTTFMNQVTWRSIYEAEGQYYIDQIRVPYVGTSCTKEGATLLPLGAAPRDLGPRAARGHRLLRWFSNDWVARAPNHPSILADVRYSLLPYGTEPFWGITVNEDLDEVEWVQTREERKTGFKAVLDLVFRNPPGSVCH